MKRLSPNTAILFGALTWIIAFFVIDLHGFGYYSLSALLSVSLTATLIHIAHRPHKNQIH